MNLIRNPDASALPALLQRPVMDAPSLEEQVKGILFLVKSRGDKALFELALRYDKAEITSLQVEVEAFEAAENALPDNLKEAIRLAQKNIEKFHLAQKEQTLNVETMPGVFCWRKGVGIEKVGLYIPGGSAPLFSTILMLGIPARIAGCKEVILCTPPGTDGGVNPAILFAARLVGISKVFRAGGAQAIAAMAYGTETIPVVSKIFGPGNQYVTCAKQLVAQDGLAIDMPAGPSELAVMADETCVPAYVAADLLSQAEHGPDSQVILVSENEDVIKAVIKEVEKQVQTLPRKAIAEKALANSKAFLVKDKQEGINLLNMYAPEHLILACTDDLLWAEKVVNAGSVFLGNFSCESAGDYASGTNHTLPTNGYARAYSGVSLDSFVKKITFQKLTEAGLKGIGPAIELMAEAEGLDAHKRAVTIRMK
ncbi:MAG: histidinol dehydrogenase [Bacteroidia bacterium]